jgi:hypothetical protein
LNPEPKNSSIHSRLQHHKKQAVILLNSMLYAYIHYFCAELALYFVLHGASKILSCPSWYK